LNRERVARWKEKNPEKIAEQQQRRNDKVREALALWNQKKREEREKALELPALDRGVVYVKEDSTDARTTEEKKAYAEQTARYARGRARRAVEVEPEEEGDKEGIEGVKRWAASRKEEVRPKGGPGVEIILEGI
jgi:hypothetical protein